MTHYTAFLGGLAVGLWLAVLLIRVVWGHG